MYNSSVMFLLPQTPSQVQESVRVAPVNLSSVVPTTTTSTVADPSIISGATLVSQEVNVLHVVVVVSWGKIALRI
jgi:hypothetical protein